MTERPPATSVSCTPALLTVRWADGTDSSFAALWLMDNDPVHRDAHSGQRLADIADLPANPRIRRAILEGGQVLIEWHGDVPATLVEASWLAAQAARRRATDPRPSSVWADGAAMDARRDCAWLGLEQLRAGTAGACAWFQRLGRDGLAFVADVPASPGAILEASALVGIVQETNYGRLFDVRSVEKASNLAYTDLGLGLHTDNPYRDPVPGYQVLHCLVAADDGGDSLFADGFAIAQQLRDADRDAFELLARTPVPFALHARDAWLEAERPLIQLDAQGSISAVHYNNRSIGTLPLHGAALDEYYRAYRQFALLLREPRFPLQLRLRAGELTVFDNWRVLHARTSYRARRHLQGCYLTRDSVCSHIALLRRDLPADRRT